MTLYYQLGNDPAKAKRVTLVCTLTAFYPKEISVEWTEDNKPFGGSPAVWNIQGEDGRFNQTSQVDVELEKWLSGSEYICKVTQNQRTDVLSTSFCKSKLQSAWLGNMEFSFEKCSRLCLSWGSNIVQWFPPMPQRRPRLPVPIRTNQIAFYNGR